jgi:PilZ domain-containing protein
MGERRFDIRLALAEIVDVVGKEPDGQTHHWAAHLVNISGSGARLRTQRPVQVGTTIVFAYQNQELTGKVRHCALRKPDYFLGIEFEPGCRWSGPLP